ncbi:N-acetylgalactosamine-6-sulfatase [Planctomycetales bacterium 10988]|nr:N-acetylgalactosamine-6-sulfatase [Planctomycetales bacterium 10988]
MTKQLCNFLLLNLTLSFLLISTSLPLNAEQQPPNIVLIVADDLGYQELGSYGQKWIETPNLDRLAKEGIKFTQFYSGSPVCAPSRCCLMTGKHSGHAYIRNNSNPPGRERNEEESIFPGQNPIPASEVTIAEMLKPLGYATAAIGKWGLGPEFTSGDPLNQGFDFFYGFNCQVHAHNHYPRFLWKNHEKEFFPGNDRVLTGDTFSQDRFKEEAIQFIEDHHKQPFFLYLPFAIPHLAIQAPQSSIDPYLEKIPEEEYKHKGYIEHPTPRAGYAAMITHMDRDIGSILETLKKHNLTDNTIVFFTSDNGPTYNRLGGSDSEFFESAGPLREFKGSVYEGGIRVPLIAWSPKRMKPGRTSNHLSAFWDFLPTIAELTGATPPELIDGISFAPTLLSQGKQKSHEFLYWEFPAYSGQQALRMGHWKAVRQNMLRGKKKLPLKPIELYHLKTDIGEEQNVADQFPAIVKKMEQVMKEQHTPSELFPFPVID